MTSVAECKHAYTYWLIDRYGLPFEKVCASCKERWKIVDGEVLKIYNTSSEGWDKHCPHHHTEDLTRKLMDMAKDRFDD